MRKLKEFLNEFDKGEVIMLSVTSLIVTFLIVVFVTLFLKF